MSFLAAPLALLGLLAAAWGWGRPALRAVSRSAADSPLAPFYTLALGLGILSYSVLALGLLGLLGNFSLLGVAAPGWVLFVVALIRGGVRVGAPRLRWVRSEWASYSLALYFGVAAALALVSVFRPVDGLDWDSLSYHLAAPKIFLREGRIPFIAYDSHTHFPFTLEMLFTWMLPFSGAAGAKSVHWAFGVLTGLALVAWTPRLRAGAVPGWSGWMAACMFVSMPLVLWEMGTAYIDLGTAFFQLLALAALLEGRQSGDRSNTFDPRSALLAGVLSGLALGTKYTALLQFGLLGLLTVWSAVTSGAGSVGWAAVALLGLGGVLVGSPWYVKNWLWVHNPVHPFFFSLFPNSFSWTRHAEQAYQTEQRSFGLGRGPADLLQVFWNLGLHGRAFYINQRTLAGDKLGSLGVHWAGLLPLLPWSRGLSRAELWILLYVGASMAAWFAMSQQTRYLTPVFAPLAACLALGVGALPAGLIRRAALAFSGAALVVNLQMHLPLAMSAAPVLLGQVSEAEYLNQSLPGLYEASQYVNTLPEESRIALYQETRGYYFDRRYFWANPLQHDLIPYDKLADGAALAGVLRQFGITHVLINYDFCRGVEASDWYRLLMSGIETGRLVESFRSAGGEPGRRGVSVYRLEVSAAP